MILVNADTDSISFCKSSHSFISESEREALLAELNALFPKRISWEDDGYYEGVYVNGPKNYVLYNEGDAPIIKGSALKGSVRENALRECIQRVLKELVYGTPEDIKAIRAEYEAEIESPKIDIRRWCSRKTISSKILHPKRTNEQKILDALCGGSFKEGDKIFVFYTPTGSLKLVEHWNNDHCKKRLKDKLKKTMSIFKGVKL